MEVYKVLLVALIKVVLLEFIECTQDMENWRKHEKDVRGFPCATPQPRSFRLQDIVDKHELPDIHTEIFPKMTVLHRCDSQSGCCSSTTRVCAPQITEDATLTFRIINRISTRSIRDGTKDKFFHVVATNHTRCSCQAAVDLPK